MAKDFLYCEETDTKIRNNDVITIATYPDIKWIAKHGWYKIGTAQKNGWYFISIADKSILPIDLVDIKDISKDENQGTSETRPEISEEVVQESPEVNVLYCSETDTKIYINDIVDISGTKYVVKFGWYRIDDEQKKDWHFISLEDRAIIPLDAIDITQIVKEELLGTSELRPTLQDMDAIPAVDNFIVIPGTDIRLYDNDIIKIDTYPGLKWVVHFGWYIYQEAQSFGWYFVSIKDGTILPASIIDLTLCSLDVLKTQGSELYDGKVVNYTRPFTDADAEVLRRSFITVDTIEQRNNLDRQKLINGKLVRVNDVGGTAGYYYWDAEQQGWFKADFGGSSSGGIPELIGTADHPIILSKIEEGLYRVIGFYQVSPDSELIETDIHHLAFAEGIDPTTIKVITESSIFDYIVTSGHITFSNEYTTKGYVDNLFEDLLAQLPDIIDARIADRFEPIPDSFIRALFST